MGSTYNAGAVSIAAAREIARLWHVTAQPCALGFAATEPAHAIATLTIEQQLLPLSSGQGTGVSVLSSSDFMPVTKRVQAFTKTHRGPQFSSGTG